ncbi:hypothetical protein [Flavobacterium sp.]|uniref:hypothetical protein n=1 Tax=Flavobacterium sp. TaxID=239 RepID=UPI00404714DC
MKTDHEMQQIAKKYLSFLERKMNTGLVLSDVYCKKPYGDIYCYTTKKELERGDGIVYSSTGPFLVEKATGRIVTFGTSYSEEEYIKALLELGNKTEAVKKTTFYRTMSLYQFDKVDDVLDYSSKGGNIIILLKK